MPVRTIRDTAPTYSAVAVDVNSNEVILQDNNLWQYLVFDRLSPTPAGPNDISQPKRTVRGDKTLIEFNNGLYVDPQAETSSRWSRTSGDKMVRFPRDASGDVPPKAMLHTPHRVYNLAADESKQELFATVEFPPQVVVYRKDATGEEKPLRTIEGDDTGLDAPHGIAVDEKDHLLFVNTWGHHSNFTVAGTGKWLPPAIEVYAVDASGDAKPLARDYGRQDATGLAGGDEVQSGKRRSVRRQRHRSIDFGVRQCAQGGWERSAGESDPRAVDAAAQSHRRGAGPEEQGSLGIESGELFGHRVSADGRR